jgi:hypothetical protein
MIIQYKKDFLKIIYFIYLNFKIIIFFYIIYYKYGYYNIINYFN